MARPWRRRHLGTDADRAAVEQAIGRIGNFLKSYRQ